MQPLWLATVAGLQGLRAPEAGREFVYGELGCGSGLNLLLAAALNPRGRFVGVDAHAAHIETARRDAQDLGLDNIDFIHTDFAQFAAQPGEAFDYLTCHGVWSWVSPRAQQAVLSVAVARLAPQGLLYLHYMCHPGSTALQPLQRLVRQQGLQTGVAPREAVRQGLALVAELSSAGLFDSQPELKARLPALAQADLDDLVHDLLSAHWAVSHSADLHAQLAGHGLKFVGSADPFQNLDPVLSVPAEILPLLQAQADPATRELLKDLSRRQRQRCDLFQRQPEPLDEATHVQALRAMSFQPLPLSPPPSALSCPTPIGALQLPAQLYAPLLQALGTGQARSVDQLVQQLPSVLGRLHELHRALQLLMQAQFIHPVQPVAARPEADRVQRLRDWLQTQHYRLQVVPDCGTAQVCQAFSRNA